MILRCLRRALCAAGLIIMPHQLSAQRLRPVSAAEQCGGERITAITLAGRQRDITDKFGALGAWVNHSARALDPQTNPGVISRFLLLHVGDACNEQRRAESESILLAQPYISDAVIRVEHGAPGEVTLRVETIDEYMLFLAVWGVAGVPVGFEAGTGNLFGGARTLSSTLDYGRGGDIGGGAKFADYQAFGQPIVLRASVSSRQLSHYGSISLDEPLYTNFQTTSWHASTGYNRGYVAFHDTTFGARFIDYNRSGWALGGSTRLRRDSVSGASFGLMAAGEYANPIQTVVIGPSGPVPISAPELTARYVPFQSARVGFSASYSSLRFLSVRGLDYLSAPEDIAFGWSVGLTALKSVDLFRNEGRDLVTVFGVSGTTGSSATGVQASANVEARMSAGDNSLPGVVGSGRIGWFGKTSLGHTTSIGVEFAGGVRTRLPLELSFRDDDGLIGYRSRDFGGAQRTLIRIEDRYAIPSPSEKLELAVAGLVQGGRLVAGDASYGVTTPWYYGVGVALIGAVPAGAKHTVRLEFGVPVNPSGSRHLEFRIGYGDRTAFFGGEPSGISAAREVAR